jgi:hypothetical protein
MGYGFAKVGLVGVTLVAPCAVYCSMQFSATPRARTVCSLLLDSDTVLCHTACVSHRSPVDLCHLSAEWLLPNRFGAMRSTWWARLIIYTGDGYDSPTFPLGQVTARMPTIVLDAAQCDLRQSKAPKALLCRLYGCGWLGLQLRTLRPVLTIV